MNAAHLAFHGLTSVLPATLILLGAWAAGAAEFPRAQHVFLVSFDGLSGTHLRAYMASSPGNFPHFGRLLREGAGTLNARCDYYASETVPNHTSMLLGRPLWRPEGWPADSYHGYANNGDTTGETYHQHGNTNAGYLASVWDVVHDHGLRTACFVSKSKLLICANSYNATHGAPDVAGEDNGANKVDYVQFLYWNFYGNNRWGILGAVTNYLQDEAPHFAFIHFADLDFIGHYFGWSSSTWSNALIDVDACLGSLMAAIENHPVLSNRTALLVTSDHGGGVPDYSHVDPRFALNYTIPFLVWGPGWPRGRDLYHLCANRFDPEGYRPDYLAPLQPIRNGDAANLALAILGLPPVPGAPLQIRPGNASLPLTVTRLPNRLVVRWPAPAGGFRLETATRLDEPAAWVPVTEGVLMDEVEWEKLLFLSPCDTAPMRWFRLRREP